MTFHKENGKWVAAYKGEQAINASMAKAGELVLSVVREMAEAKDKGVGDDKA